MNHIEKRMAARYFALVRHWSTRLIAAAGFALALSLPALGMTAHSSIPLESGSLRDWLRSLDYGLKNANQWVEPTAEQWHQFVPLFDAFFALQLESVSAMAKPLGLTVKRFGSAEPDSSLAYYVLTEIAVPGEDGFIGFGTYVLKSDGVALVIAAPHPKSDLYTGTQAIDAFINTSARYLMLPGVRRDNRTDLSHCTGASYRISDASHYHGHAFFLAHQRLNRANAATVFVQLHGFGSSSLQNLQLQCQSPNDAMVIISEGVALHPDAPDSLALTLHRKLNEGGVVQSCLYGDDTSMLGATRTTVGRLINGSADSCRVSATKSSRRFVHIEQSYSVRREHRDVVIQALDAAISDWLPEGSNNH